MKNNYVLTDKLTKDIDNLEKRIKYVKLENLKKISIRNIKIFGRVIELVAPYILAAAIPFLGQSFLFDIPFVREETKEEMHYMKEFDNKGVISYQSQYGSFSEERDRVYLYTKWELGDDEFYHRSVKTFSLSGIDIEELQKSITDPNYNIEDILGSPLSTIVENRNIIDEDDIGPYIRVKYYYNDKEDYIIVNQGFGVNLVCSLLYVCIMGLCEYGVLKFRYDCTDYSFESKIEPIMMRYKRTDPKVLEKKLEIKKENYKRLTGDNYE